MKSPFCILLCAVCLLFSTPQVWARKKSPAPTPPPTPAVEPAPKPERRFFGLLPAKEQTPPPARHHRASRGRDCSSCDARRSAEPPPPPRLLGVASRTEGLNESTSSSHWSRRCRRAARLRLPMTTRLNLLCSRRCCSPMRSPFCCHSRDLYQRRRRHNGFCCCWWW